MEIPPDGVRQVVGGDGVQRSNRDDDAERGVCHAVEQIGKETVRWDEIGC
jgi:hypothetical protein